MPSVVAAISNFASSVISIVVSLFNSLFAVFQAIFALGWDVVHSIITVVQHFTAMILDLFQGVLGFVAANFVALAVVGGAYYFYTTQQQTRRRGIVN